MLGPQLVNPCPSYPYIPLHPATTNASIALTSTSTLSSTTSTINPITTAALIPKLRETTTTVGSMTAAGVGFAVAASTALLPEQTTRLVTTALYNATDLFNSSAT